MKGLVIAIALALAICSHANDLQYNADSQAHKQALEKATWEARSCMNDAERMLLIQGVRDREAIVDYAAKACGIKIREVMMAFFQAKEESTETETYIKRLAENELKNIPGVTPVIAEPIPSEKASLGGIGVLTGSNNTPNSPDTASDASPNSSRQPSNNATAQHYESLSPKEQALMHKAVSDVTAPEPRFPSATEKINWLSGMSRRLEKHMPDRPARLDFLKTVYYEAQRAGLDPQLVLAVIQISSGFKKYAVSSVGARGYMQVMPFWIKVSGAKDQNLFHMRVNLRYGCWILRHYLDIEKGDLYRALGRYNGSLGRPEYPNMVRAAWEKHWAWPSPTEAIHK